MGKNKVTRNLSSSAVENFSGYEMIKQRLARKERNPTPINLVYEPGYDEKVSVPCFFTDQIYMAYRSYSGQFAKGKEQITNRTVKQCYYCKNFFRKNGANMKKHLSICAAREGITYSFDNGQIITFQDNFKYLGDVPFTVYFDLKTTTGDSGFFLA